MTKTSKKKKVAVKKKSPAYPKSRRNRGSKVKAKSKITKIDIPPELILDEDLSPVDPDPEVPVLNVSRETIIQEVLSGVKEKKLTYIQSVLNVAEKYRVEPQFLAPLLSRPIVEKIEKEAVDLNFLKTNSDALPEV